MNRYIILLLSLVIFSCKSDRDTENTAANIIDTSSFQKKLKIDTPDYALEPDARQYALNWVEFITAQNEIRKMEKASINDIKNNAGAIAQIMESLKNSVPDSLRSVAVEARLNVVNTKAQLLQQYAGRQEPMPQDIRQTAEELHLEFNNLKLQMNEIFLKTLEEFEKELDEFELEEREADSITRPFQQEL